MFKGVYFLRGSLYEVKKGYSPSYAWSSILKTSNFVAKGSAWQIGDEKKVRIWHDSWLPHGLPIIFCHDVAHELGLEKVVDLLLLERR